MQVNQVRLGAVLSYVSMGLSTLISLIYTPIMLGRLGETEYGVYGAVGPIISYLLLLSMGLGSAYIRYYSQAKVAKDRREMAKLNGMFLVTLSLLGLVLLALGFFLAAHPQMVFGTKWAPEELALGAKLLRIMTLNAALSFPFSVFESHVNIHERYLFLKAVTMAKSVLSPLISIPLLLLGFRSPAIATLSLVLTIVCGLTYMAYCFAVLKMPVSFRTYDLPLMKNMMGFTFYIFLAVVVDQLNYGIGTLMTTWIHGAELSGVYYSANQLNVYYLSFAMAISNVLIPRVHRMVAEGDSNRELTRLMTKAGRLQFIMLMAVFLGFVAVGRPFVILWAGGKEQFAVDYPVALLLFASTIVSAIQFVGLEILRAKNMHRFRAWVYLAAAAVNVGLMIPLCKYGGLVGGGGERPSHQLVFPPPCGPGCPLVLGPHRPAAAVHAGTRHRGGAYRRASSGVRVSGYSHLGLRVRGRLRRQPVAVWHEPLRAGHRHRRAGQIPPQAPQKGIISFKQPKGLAVCKVQAAGPFDIPAADGLPGRAGETVCATAPS